MLYYHMYSLPVDVLGTGVPGLACLRPAAWLEWWPSTAHLHQHKAQDPREGPSLAGQTMHDFLGNGLARKAREEAERSRQGTLRGARDASHDNRDQAGVRRVPSHAVSLFPLWCKGGKHMSRPICNPIQKELEGPTKDRPAY